MQTAPSIVAYLAASCYEACRAATEIWEWKAVLPADSFLLVQGVDAIPRALISRAKVQRYMAA
jgi:hypothetical protein